MKKKLLEIFLPIIIVGGIVVYLIYKIQPIDDTKKLYISCNSISESYDLESGKEITFSDEDNACYLVINIENVDKTYLKIKADRFMYPLDGNGDIDDDSISHTFFVLPDEKLVLYSYDKETKFEFQYK